MMNIFQKGEKMLQGAFKYASCSVAYRRAGEVIAEDIPAKLGKTVFRYSSAGMTIRSEQRDFILRYADINIEPHTGDEILFNREVFIVCAPNDEPCWKWHTRTSHAEIRIHAKHAGGEESVLE